MANRYLRTVGGNYSADASWSTTSGGAADTVKPTASDAVILDALSGNLTVDANSVGSTFNASAYLGTMTHNAFFLTITTTITFGAAMTYTPLATSTVAQGASGTITTAGKLMPIVISNSGTMTLGDNMTFMNSKVMSLSLTGTGLNLNGFTVSGNSSINRVYVKSSNVGTAKTVTLAGGTFANADFQDITFSSASNVDLSAITGGSGDCGGNGITGGGSTVTFTSPVSQTATMSSDKNWSDVTIWTSRVPLPQDDVSGSGITGGILTADMPRLGKSISFTGATGTPTWAFNIGNSIFGSLTMISGMTLTGTNTPLMCGRGSYTITTAGKQPGWTMVIQAPNGTYTLLDNFVSTGGTFQIANGGFDANGFSVTSNRFVYTGTLTRALTLNTGTWTTTSTSATSMVDATTTTGLTFSGASSTIVMSGSTSATRTFIGGGLTYGTYTYNLSGSTGKLQVTGSNSYSQFNFSDASNARSLEFTAATTTTIRTPNGFNVRGTPSKLMTVSSITAATHTISSAYDQSCDYLNLVNSIATGGGVFYAGSHSTDGGGNTGWIFSDPPGMKTFSDEGLVS